MRTRIFVVFTFMMLISLPGKTSLYCKLGDAIITYNQKGFEKTCPETPDYGKYINGGENGHV